MVQEIKEILNEYKEETKRHFDVVTEGIKDEIKLVAEGVSGNDQKITSIRTKLLEHDQRFENIEGDLQIIKLDVSFIKNELKQKVNRDEFAVLEKRVGLIEAQLSQ